MEIKFKEKPTKELVKRFCRKIEEYLSSQKLKISVELWDYPLGPIRSYVNDVHVEDTYIWIKKCSINTPKTDGDLKVRLFDQGLDENMSDGKIWIEAHHIQNQLYSRLKKNPGNPQDNDSDPYWDLWDHNPNKKK